MKVPETTELADSIDDAFSNVPNQDDLRGLTATPTTGRSGSRTHNRRELGDRPQRFSNLQCSRQRKGEYSYFRAISLPSPSNIKPYTTMICRG